MKYQRPDMSWGEYPHRLKAADLEKLDKWLAAADAVVPLRDVARGRTGPAVVGMRHDVDHNLDHAVLFAEWEAERGYAATYFVLHTAWYYDDKDALYANLERLVELGHEVGLHSNATVVAAAELPARERWKMPGQRFSDVMSARLHDVIADELGALRDHGFDVVGVAAHGDIGTYEMGVYNDLRFTRLTLEQFGLEYDADRLRATGRLVTDNHGTMHGSLQWTGDERQPFTSIHPCHWDLLAAVTA